MFLASGTYSLKRSAAQDDPFADDAQPPVLLAAGLRAALEDFGSYSVGRAGGDPRNVWEERLRLDGAVLALGPQVDDLFSAEPDGPTYAVTRIDRETDWLLPGDLLVYVRRVD